ncbi:MAG TPA: SusD/RagB family nutrient-binding outer membrane lipoprotein, partial [Bacteroidales bacterium]|nr:SusD/RagB family nutrient-binding outer membrane lipoprotein [Bacteroidales bacterium]
MKTVIKITSGVLMIFMLFGCTKNFDKINEDPNYPTEVTTSSLMTAAQKGLCDDIYDEWWGGRQSMVWSEYWTQRNYT